MFLAVDEAFEKQHFTGPLMNITSALKVKMHSLW